MKVYEVECRAVITIAEEDMQKAALQCEAVIKDSPHLIYASLVREQFAITLSLAARDVKLFEPCRLATYSCWLL
jgi:hypothetical protein